MLLDVDIVEKVESLRLEIVMFDMKELEAATVELELDDLVLDLNTHESLS